jgi:predicted MFS family arabinose efflux permease
LVSSLRVRERTNRRLSAQRQRQYAITAVFAVSGFALATWFSRVPAVRDNLHASTAQMSILLLGLSVGSIAGLSLAPTIITRWGTRRGLFMSMGSTALGLLLMAFATDAYPSLAGGCVALAVFGFANGSTDVFMNVEGARAEKAIGHTRLPLMHGFFSIGTIIGALFGALAATIGMSLTVHLSAMAAVTLVIGGLAVAQLPRGDIAGLSVARPNDRPAELGGGWLDLRLLCVGIIIAGTTFAEGAANDWISLAAVDGHDFTNSGGAYIYGCFVAAMTAGRLAGGRLLDRYGQATVLATLAAIGIAGVVLMILGTGTVAIVTGTVLWGLGLSLGFPACISAAADHPTHAARRVSAVSICGYATFLVRHRVYR